MRPNHSWWPPPSRAAWWGRPKWAVGSDSRHLVQRVRLLYLYASSRPRGLALRVVFFILLPSVAFGTVGVLLGGNPIPARDFITGMLVVLVIAALVPLIA